MKEQLQSIIDQKVTSFETVEILKSALKELKKINNQQREICQFIAQAEDKHGISGPSLSCGFFL